MSLLLRALAIALALSRAAPDVDQRDALANALAAIAAVGDGVAPELMVALAYEESRLDPTATSRVAGRRRVTGPWPSSSPAGRGPRFCGVAQAVAGEDWGACLALRPLGAGYAAGAAELRYWLRRSGGDVAAALRGHGCGNAGLAGPCRGYDRRVMALARALGWRR